MIKKVLIGASATVAAIVLAASPALAHFCSVANRSDQGNQSVLKNSPAWMTFREAAPLFLCEAGAAYFVTTADAQDLDIDSPFNTRAVMGGGALEGGHQPGGISYAFELFPVFEAADALCPPPPGG